MGNSICLQINQSAGLVKRDSCERQLESGVAPSAHSRAKVRSVIVDLAMMLLLALVVSLSNSHVDASVIAENADQVVQLASAEEIELVSSPDVENSVENILLDVDISNALDMSGEVHPLDRRGGSGGNQMRK